LLTGDIKARDQYITSANGIIDNLIYISPQRNLLYATDLNSGRPTHKYEHLTCFFARDACSGSAYGGYETGG